MRQIITTILILIYSIGSGQECSGPLNITLEGAPTGMPLTVNANKGHIFCNGTNEGSITLNINGGTPNYTCVWNTGVSEESLFNLSAGHYSVTVTDATNCTSALEIQLKQIHPLDENLYLADYHCCEECTINDGESTFLYEADDYFLYFSDIEDQKNVGEIYGCLTIADENPKFQNYNLITRRWSIEPILEKVKIRFFFTESELLDLAIEAGYDDINSEVFENLHMLHFTGVNNNYVSHSHMQTYKDVKFEKFDEQDVWFAEIQPNEVRRYRSGYTLSLISKDEMTTSVDPYIPSQENILVHKIKTNPVSTELEILASDPQQVGEGLITIVSRSGQIIHKEKFINESLHHKKLNVTDLPDGLYFLSIDSFSEARKEVIKFVKYK